MTQECAIDKIRKARASLILSQPFFASLALRLQVIEDPTCETLWTDGQRLGFNPEFVDSLTLDEVKGTICHEVMHCACSHQFRRGNKHHATWNQACDYAINPIISESGMVLPAGCLNSSEFKDKSAEEVYMVLASQQDKAECGNSSQSGGGSGNNNQQSNDPGKCGEVRDNTGDKAEGANSSQTEQESAWRIAVSQAAQQAKTQGNLPAGLARMIDSIINPAVDWKSVLRRFVDNTAKNDYSWSRPNRRYISAGLYLPSLQSESLPPIVCAIDTSGSVNQGILNQFAAEISCILEDYKTTVNVLYCDSRIEGHEEFTSDNLPVKLSPKGGGGTDFRPVFDYIEESGMQPSCLIYLTDMHGKFPEQEPSYPVLWGTIKYNRESVPFGESVKII
jgi:predicted metal-dependent peptidase